MRIFARSLSGTRRVLEGGREAMLEAGAVVLVTLSVFLRRVQMPWKESSVMDERLPFVARLTVKPPGSNSLQQPARLDKLPESSTLSGSTGARYEVPR